MRKLAKNLIFLVLIISAVSVADFSSASDGRENFLDCDEIQFTGNVFVDMPANNNSEFWSKFRESVMPDNSRKNENPNHEKNPPPPDSNMPEPHGNR